MHKKVKLPYMQFVHQNSNLIILTETDTFFSLKCNRSSHYTLFEIKLFLVVFLALTTKARLLLILVVY